MVDIEIQARLDKIKKKRKWALRWFTWGWGLWFAETVFFLAMYGWHTTPANPVEKVCDHITGVMMLVGIIKMISVMWQTDELIIELGEDE